MNLLDLHDVFRQEVGDLAKPYLWQDTVLNEFANDAVMEAVRRGLSIIDSTTPAICEIPYTTNSILSLDPRIIAIRGASLNLGSPWTSRLERGHLSWMDWAYPDWRTTTSAYPSLYIDDWGSNKIRLYPTPTVAGTVYLSVSREPLVPLRQYQDIPEIPARHHRSLVHWMKYRCYSKDDTETQSGPKAAQALQAFTSEFGERKSARNERWQAEQANWATATLI